MRAVSAEIEGTRYCLLYNMGAMLDIEEAYGANAIEKIGGGTRGSLEAAVDIFNILAGAGASARRRMGYPPETTAELDIGDVMPLDLIKIKTAIVAAVNAGLEQEFDSGEDVDLILLEYQKKTKNA